MRSRSPERPGVRAGRCRAGELRPRQPDGAAPAGRAAGHPAGSASLGSGLRARGVTRDPSCPQRAGCAAACAVPLCRRSQRAGIAGNGSPHPVPGASRALSLPPPRPWPGLTRSVSLLPGPRTRLCPRTGPDEHREVRHQGHAFRGQLSALTAPGTDMLVACLETVKLPFPHSDGDVFSCSTLKSTVYLHPRAALALLEPSHIEWGQAWGYWGLLLRTKFGPVSISKTEKPEPHLLALLSSSICGFFLFFS